MFDLPELSVAARKVGGSGEGALSMVALRHC